MIKIVPVAACLMLAMTPSFAASETASKPAEDSKMVCKRVAGTGWRLSTKKVCRTKAEWTAVSRAQRDEVQRHSQSGRAGSTGD